ncbi:alpha-N-acetylglucosaminidase [Streptomyces sp. T-3]|nr:alpha-N-acetylglucosaminidase [Streptomyces sp. T-3]
MALGRRTFLTALAGTTAIAATACSRAAGAAGPSAVAALGGAQAAARRLLPGHWEQLTFRSTPRKAGQDVFRVSGESGRITVEGSSPGVQLAGLRWYLKHEAHANITWAGEQLNLPKLLPAPRRTITGRSNARHRFALNDTNDGYTSAYHDWSYWERELDVLALHGYNEVLVYVGADALYHRVFQEFGYAEQELREWIPGPAHQPWWLLQNMAAFPAPVSRQLLDARAALGRRIADRVRELGMTPVFPGYFGTVPPGFAEKNPGAKTVPQGDWMGFRRPDWLDPRGTHFARVASAFYRRQEQMFGTSALYKMDLLHEGGKPGDVPVPEAARGVEKALQDAHPGATWVILGWQHNPPKAITDAVDKSRMLVVDGLSDRFTKITDRESDWGSTPYTFGSIWNFGGHTALGANTPDWAALYEKWRTKPGSTMAGIALMPEAADNNPAAFELFSELAWTEGDLDLEAWFATWALSRYGARDAHAAAAWDILRRTAYGTTRADEWSEAADGLFGARPGLSAKSAAAWSPEQLRYPAADFEPALTELLAVAPALRSSSAYRRDLLDVARQALSNRSRVLLPQIRQAYEAGDRARFKELTGTWLKLMDLLDRLVATDSRHLLGRWVADARTWGADAAERDRLAYDQLSLLTVWGTREGADAGLRDYANREWAGLVGGLYRLRWSTYFEELAAALEAGREPRAIDWFALEDKWTRAPGRLRTEPEGDTYELAVEVARALK